MTITYGILKYDNGSVCYTNTCPQTARTLYIETDEDVLEDLNISGEIKHLYISSNAMFYIKNIKLPSTLKSLRIGNNHNLQSISGIELPDECDLGIGNNPELQILQNIQFPKNGKLYLVRCAKLSCLNNINFPSNLTDIIIQTTSIEYLPIILPLDAYIVLIDNKWRYSPPKQEIDVTYITENALTIQELKEQGLCLLPNYIAVWYYEKHQYLTYNTEHHYSVRKIAILEIKN